ncbi:Sodium/potassium-transporting ATPase subunit beta-1-interacting protein 2 [Platysternon megacephalum]|uniref:PTB domain-containing engulfment adapter protein 1 n=1 Tax=Platysternon megacephalum TaxID=55544 RepID=A0A4D9F501_9SAUR|nr:Sodium/potassium-transporting ATPase subunit beta-1-interacting protein 2 [Platysternon megacephalum]
MSVQPSQQKGNGKHKIWLKCHKTENIFDWLILNMNRAFSRKKDKTWMHTPEALSKHYIPYNAKFLGSTEVEHPKGTEVVRDAVRKLKFARHIKKSEGQKTPKVELQISIYGVKILDPKTKEVQHNCQLHRISFCADDKTDKRIFTFICKDSESNKHLCYVFDSEKCAEEITLTIGQAFDLAYRKFLESGGKDVETRKQIAGLQKRIQELETENIELKNKVQDLENQLRINQIHTSPAGSVTPKSPSTDIFDMVPFSPISPQSSTPTRNGTQPPPVPSRSAEIKRDLFGAEPFDPFSCGAGDFPPDIQSKLDEMQLLVQILETLIYLSVSMSSPIDVNLIRLILGYVPYLYYLTAAFDTIDQQPLGMFRADGEAVWKYF